MTHVGTKGGKFLLDRLLITDISKYLVKERKAATLLHRQISTVLVKKRKETECFYGNGFSSGVGPGENNRLDSLFKDDCNRDRFLFEKGVASIEEADHILGILDVRTSILKGPPT